MYLVLKMAATPSTDILHILREMIMYWCLLEMSVNISLKHCTMLAMN